MGAALSHNKKFVYSDTSNKLRIIRPTHADVVAGMSRVFICSVRTYVCVSVYVSTVKQKPLDVSSPNLAGG